VQQLCSKTDCCMGSRLSQVLPFEILAQIDRSSREHEHSVAAIVEGDTYDDQQR